MTILEVLLKAFAERHGISEEAAADALCKKSEDGSKPTELKDDVSKILAKKDKERVKKIKSGRR